jgi:hypothetical protein
MVTFVSIRSGFLLLILLLLGLGFYAAELNSAFYQRHIPFYDSCSYLNQMAAVFHVSQAEGPVKAAIGGMWEQNLALPWIESAVLAKVMGPSRPLSVWMQWVWLCALGASVYWYFVKYRRVAPWQAVCLTLPFTAFESALHWAGGLQDFRMDLSLYIFLSLSVVWYLIASEQNALWPWMISGGFATLAILARALAPVYLSAMLGPVLLWQFHKERGKLLGRMAAMLAMMLPGLAYLIWNRHGLYQYYAVNSPDANAHLSWRQAAMHVVLGFAHAGLPLAVASMAFFAGRVAPFLRNRWRELDWRLAYMGLAPVLVLTVRGAGMNPYVSMPAVFGILLFAYFPLREAAPVSKVLYLALPAACLVNLFTVNARLPFRGVDDTNMSAMQKVADEMISDAASRGLTTVRYAIPGIGDFHSCAFENTLIYDRGGTAEDEGVKMPSGALLAFSDEGALTAQNPVIWNSLPGGTDEEKMRLLAARGLAKDYLLIPPEATIEYLVRTRPFNLINLKLHDLRRRWLESGRLVKLGDANYISPAEGVELYAVRPATP